MEAARVGWAELTGSVEAALGGGDPKMPGPLEGTPAGRAAAALAAAGRGPLVAGWFLEAARCHAVEVDRPVFWEPLAAFTAQAEVLSRPQLAEWVGVTLKAAFGRLRTGLDTRAAIAAELDDILSGGRGSTPSCSGFRALVLPLVLDRAQPVLPGMLLAYLQDNFELANAADAALAKARKAEAADEEEEEEDDDDAESDEDRVRREELVARVAEDPGAAWAAALAGAAELGAALQGLESLALALDAGTEVLFGQITAHITRVASAKYDAPGLLQELTSWLERAVLPWLAALLAGDPAGLPEAAAMDEDHDGDRGAESEAAPVGPSGPAAAYAQWRRRLEFHLYETVASLRTAELFDIIIEYPDSLPALLHLRACLERTRLHPGRLLATLTESLNRRLLHPGAMTQDILAQFISTVKALRHLDPELPAAASLQAIGAPIKEYLRGRADTIRCIVTALTDDPELLEDSLAAAADKPALQEDDSSDEELPAEPVADTAGTDGAGSAGSPKAPKQWMPAPAPTLPAAAAAAGGGGGGGDTDIISMLINIYGSKELFVGEYRTMLGQKLVKDSTFELNKEKRNLELLKLRFAEGAGTNSSGRVTSLHSCEVMLKDVTDSNRLSRRIQANVKAKAEAEKAQAEAEEEEEQQPFHCPTTALQPVIVSHVFWPKLPPAPTEVFKLPLGMAAPVAQYEAEYAALKAPRKLVWAGAGAKPSVKGQGYTAHNVGQVTMQLDFDKGLSREYSVLPLDAAIIGAFAGIPNGDSQPASSLATLLAVEPAVIQRRAATWLDHYVLELDPDAPELSYRVVADPAAAEAAALGDGKS